MRLPSQTATPALAAAAAAILLPTSLLGFLAHDQVSFGAWTHFVGVGFTALAATAAAIALTIAGASRGDGRTVLLGTAFTVMAALVTGLLSGLLPALRAGAADPLGGLKARGAVGTLRLRTGRILVVAQIGLSLLLLTGAGLFLRSNWAR